MDQESTPILESLSMQTARFQGALKILAITKSKESVPKRNITSIAKPSHSGKDPQLIIPWDGNLYLKQ